MIWGEYDRVFPIELGHRLKKYVLLTIMFA